MADNGNGRLARLTQRQQAFVLHYYETGNATQSAIAAGYTPSRAAQTASRLVRNGKVETRLAELNQAAEDASIANVVERKQVLTEIVRGRFAEFMTNLTKEKLKSAALQEIRITEIGQETPIKTTTIKLHNPIQAIAELNKMEHVYEVGARVNIDNRTLEVTVVSQEAQSLLDKVRDGQGTEKEQE